MKVNRSLILYGLLFVLSGVASLVYQISWFKQLSYFMGNGTYAQSIVLATFMGGLAIGAWYFGKLADKIGNVFKLFALLEIGIGVYCYFYAPIFEFAQNGFTDLVISNQLKSDGTSVLFLKILFAGLVMLIPTILMGGTLPVLVKCISAKLEDVGSNVAALYFINSLGAVLGSIVAGFYLIDLYGLEFTTKLGAGTDFLVGMVFLWISTKSNNTEKKAQETKDTPEKIKSSKLKTTLLVVAGISGACAMIYELTWLRLLIPILSSTTYSFTVVVTAFILGITLGSLIIYFFIDRINNKILWLAICQFGVIASTCLSVLWYEKTPYIIWSNIEPNFSEGNYDQYIRIQFLLVFALMLLPTIFMGMLLPLASKAYTSSLAKSGESIGRIFGINTLGSVVGTLLGGLVLIPTIGIKSTIDLALFLGAITGTFLLIKAQQFSNLNKTIISGIVLIPVWMYAENVNKNRWINSVMLSEVSRSINREKAPKSFTQFLKRSRSKAGKIKYYKEGIAGTIVVGQKMGEVFLYTNGKGDANSVSDLQTQSSLGHTSILMHPKPDSVFVIGFGAGHTIGSVMTHRDVKYAQVAEISPEVIEASQYFNHVNEEPLKDARLQVIEDDGLASLRLSPYKYDVIISQPSNPWSAGVGNLFTKEFFEDCKAKLRPGGIVAQWFNLYEIDDNSLQLVIRTIRSEFKFVSVWNIGNSDVLFLCSEKDFDRDLNLLKTRFNKVKKHTSKQNISIHSFGAFLSQESPLSMDALDLYAGKGPLNTEDHPLLELWAPKAYFYNRKPKNFTAHANNDIKKAKLFGRLISKQGLTEKDKIEIALFKSNGGEAGNKAFLQTLSYLTSDKHVFKQSVQGDPAKLELGILGSDQKIIPLDSANNVDQLSSWTCCANYKVDNKITMLWESPEGKVYKNEYQHSKDWVTSWTGAPGPQYKTTGWWKINALSAGKIILADSIYIGPQVKKQSTEFPHNNIRMVAKIGKQLVPLTKIHPMQKAYLNTFGKAYGKIESTKIIWTSPSAKKSEYPFTYQANYTNVWIPKRGAIPMEIGKWQVTIQDKQGSALVDHEFVVDPDAKLISN